MIIFHFTQSEVIKQAYYEYVFLAITSMGKKLSIDWFFHYEYTIEARVNTSHDLWSVESYVRPQSIVVLLDMETLL